MHSLLVECPFVQTNKNSTLTIAFLPIIKMCCAQVAASEAQLAQATAKQARRAAAADAAAAKAAAASKRLRQGEAARSNLEQQLQHELEAQQVSAL